VPVEFHEQLLVVGSAEIVAWVLASGITPRGFARGESAAVYAHPGLSGELVLAAKLHQGEHPMVRPAFRPDDCNTTA